MVEYACADIATLAPEIAPLMRANWAERHANAPRYALEPNLDVYCDAEERGLLRLYTARENRALVGYMVVLVASRPHAVSDTVGAVDALYVSPSHRANGVATDLLRFAEERLKLAGVTTMAVGANDPRIVRWLRMTSGYSYAETLLEKEL